MRRIVLLPLLVIAPLLAEEARPPARATVIAAAAAALESGDPAAIDAACAAVLADIATLAQPGSGVEEVAEALRRLSTAIDASATVPHEPDRLRLIAAVRAHLLPPERAAQDVVALREMLDALAGDRRVDAYRAFVAGSPADRALLRFALTRFDGPPTRRLRLQTAETVEGGAVGWSWAYRFPAGGAWGPERLTVPNGSFTSAEAPVQVTIGAGGLFGSRSGGGKRRVAGHPLAAHRFWRTGARGASGSGRVEAPRPGVVQVAWSTPAVEPVRVAMPEDGFALACAGGAESFHAVVPVHAAAERWGTAVDGVRLTAEPSDDGRGVTVRLTLTDGRPRWLPWSERSVPIWLLAIPREGVEPVVMSVPARALDASDLADFVQLTREETTISIVTYLPGLGSGVWQVTAGYGPVAVDGDAALAGWWRGELVAPPVELIVP